MDNDGHPTTDPAEAIRGLLTPIGGFKGTGLAMIMGVLSSMLSGAAHGTELGTLETGATHNIDGHFVMMLRVNAFEDSSVFKRRVDAAIQQIHACELAPEFERVYAPGELEFITREHYLRDGIPLNAVTQGEIAQAARQLGLTDAGKVLQTV